MKLKLFTFIVFFLLNQKINAKGCDPKWAYQIGAESYCQTFFDNETISCHGPSLGIYKMNLKCKKGYYNPKFIREQSLKCDPKSGEWDKEAMICVPECNSNVNGFEFYENYPISNALIDREYHLGGGIVNQAVGIILSERHILTENDMYSDLKKFRVKIINFETYLIDHEHNYNPSPIVHLKESDYIVFNDKIKPICPYTPLLGKLRRNDLLEKYLLKPNFLPSYNSGSCKLPNINDTSTIDIQCYQIHSSLTYPIDCNNNFIPKPFIKIDCKFGHKIQKDHRMRGGFSNSCIYNKWSNNEIIKCEPFCGKKNNLNESQNDPWTVEVFHNNQTICGGVIIHKSLVLTAASCYYDTEENKLKDPGSFKVGVREFLMMYYRVFRISVPETFSPVTLNDNFALLHTNYFMNDLYNHPICINLDDTNENLKVTEGYSYYYGNEKDFNYNFFNKKRMNLTFNPDSKEESTLCANIKDSQLLEPNITFKSGFGFIAKERVNNEDLYFLKGIWSYKDGANIIFTNLNSIKEFIKKELLELKHMEATQVWNNRNMW